jgi:poly(A) polymerase
VPAAGIAAGMLDQDALRVLSRLVRSDFEAYLVGGCVRDLLLGRKPKDFDVATSAHPRQIKRLFHNGRIIGRRFKLVHVTYGSRVIETATFRRAPERSDEEEDLLIVEDNVFGSAAQDARRRDFTINALFLDVGDGGAPPTILDYVGGLEDLEQGLLRTIGDPRVRMAEDPVRILRAVKFATRLGFRIEEHTWEAMCAHAGDLERSAKPRVLEEIFRLMRSGTALGAVRMLRACGALAVILPPLEGYLGPRDDPDPAAHDRADSYWRLLEALDADVHQGASPSSAVLLAVLFLRLIEREADPATRTLRGPAPELGLVIDEVLGPFALNARLARRDVAQARRIVLVQRRFTQPASQRFRPMWFVRSEEFADALHLFKLRCMAWGQGWDVYEAWVERARRSAELSGEELEALRPRRRRRRRRSASDRSQGQAPEPEAHAPPQV